MTTESFWADTLERGEERLEDLAVEDVLVVVNVGDADVRLRHLARVGDREARGEEGGGRHLVEGVEVIVVARDPLKKSPWQKMAKRIAAVHAKHSLLDDRVASVLDLLDEA